MRCLVVAALLVALLAGAPAGAEEILELKDETLRKLDYKNTGLSLAMFGMLLGGVFGVAAGLSHLFLAVVQLDYPIYAGAIRLIDENIEQIDLE